MKANPKKARSRPRCTVEDVVTSAEISAIRCRELSAKIADDVDVVGQIGLRPDVSIDVGVLRPLSEGRLTVIARVILHGMVTAEVDGNAREFPLVTVSTLYQLEYTLPSSLALTEEVAKEFASGNGVFNAWPFLREALHEGTRRLGFEPFTLPLLRLQPAVKKT